MPESAGRLALDNEFEVYGHDNQVYIRIQHTARTWGADIEGILSRHITTIVKKNSRFFNFFQYNPDNAQNSISGILAVVTLVFSVFYTNKKLSRSEALDDPIFWMHHYGSLIFLILGIYILGRGTLIVLEEFEVYSKPAFVLLTAESFKQKDKTLASFKNKWRKYLGTIIGSIVLGIVGNYIYGVLTQ